MCSHVCCHFVPSGLCQWCHKQGWMKSVAKVLIVTTKPAFFFFSFLTKITPAWLWLRELKIKAKEHCLCINIDITTKWSLQMEIFVHFLCFQASLRLPFSSPLNWWKLWIYFHNNWILVRTASTICSGKKEEVVLVAFKPFCEILFIPLELGCTQTGIFNLLWLYISACTVWHQLVLNGPIWIVLGF